MPVIDEGNKRVIYRYEEVESVLGVHARRMGLGKNGAR